MVAADEVPIVWTKAETWDDVNAPPPNPRNVMSDDVYFEVDKRTFQTGQEKMKSAIDSVWSVVATVEKRGTGKPLLLCPV